jgi:N-acetylmuramoyl-L-alanine amidase
VRSLRDLARQASLALAFVAAAGCAGVGGKAEHPEKPTGAARTAEHAKPMHPLAAWERRPVHTIVIDAGHGGRDPGAIGLGGLKEKDVTLDLAQRMQTRLTRWGFRVVMTRAGDETLDLSQRTARAESGSGDVFLSLHVNAAPRPGAAGIETYYLDETDERHSDDVAARENGVSPEQSDTLQRTLAQMRVSEVSVRSAQLAKQVHGAILRGLRSRYGATEDLGIRKGPFYVLFLSTMPAVLVEVGFATNPRDAERLRDEAYLELLADRISSGLMAYAIASVPVVAAGER